MKCTILLTLLIFLCSVGGVFGYEIWRHRLQPAKMPERIPVAAIQTTDPYCTECTRCLVNEWGFIRPQGGPIWCVNCVNLRSMDWYVGAVERK